MAAATTSGSRWARGLFRVSLARCWAVESKVMNGASDGVARKAESASDYAMATPISASFQGNRSVASHAHHAAADDYVNLFLNMMWRPAAKFAKEGAVCCVAEVPMSPDALNSLLSLCLGFALAGALASGYQALAQRPAGFGLLQDGVAPKTFAAVPFLVFAAPFIIMRNTLRGARIERRRFEFVMMATIIAGFWSLMSGTFFVMTLRAAGLLA